MVADGQQVAVSLPLTSGGGDDVIAPTVTVSEPLDGSHPIVAVHV